MQEVENIEAPHYEAPAIESVMTLEEMEREFAYAGSTLPSGRLK
jgi:hypothetical protein